MEGLEKELCVFNSPGTGGLYVFESELISLLFAPLLLAMHQCKCFWPRRVPYADTKDACDHHAASLRQYLTVIEIGVVKSQALQVRSRLSIRE